MNTLGVRLKALREKKDLTQQDLANVLNIGNTTLSQYETGQRIPSDAIKIRIADYFDVSLDYLLGRTNDKPKIDTIAAFRNDDPMSELPEEARKSVEEFIEYVYQKYKK